MSNPNGANENIPDPRQTIFLANYLDYKSSTFSNCLQSALKAGYSQQYAENMLNLMPKWLSESMDATADMKRLKRAERNLSEVQNLEIVDAEGKIDINLIDKRTRVDMFVAERLDKSKYSTRQKQTGKDGKDLIPETLSQEEKEKLAILLNDKTSTG